MKFSYGRLAQIKFLLPEATQIHKIMLHDKLEITMQEAWYDCFASRLVDYFTKHPEVCHFSLLPVFLTPDEFSMDRFLWNCELVGLSKNMTLQFRWRGSSSVDQKTCQPDSTHQLMPVH